MRAPCDARRSHAPVDEQVADDVARQTLEELRAPVLEPAPATPATADRATVLVVEDNPDMSRFIRDTLGDRHRVVTAFDGREGLRAALASAPDLIVSDVMMPEMSGDEMIRAIRLRRELDGVAIIVLTARADEQLRIALLRDGAQDYLIKPFSADELRVRVENLLAMTRAKATLQRELATQTDDLEQLAREVVTRRRELEAKEELQRFLSSATAMLAESLDYRRTLARVASLAVPVLADWCVLDLIEEDRRIRRVEVAHADPANAALAAEVMKYTIAPDGNLEHPPTKELLANAPVLHQELGESDLRAMTHSSGHFEVMRAAGLVSMMSVPLVAHDRTLGVLSFGMAKSGRRYTPDD
ncbi:MAG: response regulator, partial [Myxococcota bacterium]